jgi:aminopeptidase N
MLQKNEKTNPEKMLSARNTLRDMIATHLTPIFETIYRDLNITEKFLPTAQQAGKRQLKNTSLSYLIKANKFPDSFIENMYKTADNMTDKIAVLGSLSDKGGDLYATLMNNFYNEFEKNPLVIDKWFALQARATADTVLDSVKTLLEHPAFTYKNPNRARSLIGVFLHGNPARFHSKAGYEFAHQEILKLDALNPKTAARMATAFETVLRLDDSFVGFAKTELETMLHNKDTISNDVFEIISKIYNSL